MLRKQFLYDFFVYSSNFPDMPRKYILSCLKWGEQFLFRFPTPTIIAWVFYRVTFPVAVAVSGRLVLSPSDLKYSPAPCAAHTQTSLRATVVEQEKGSSLRSYQYIKNCIYCTR